MRRFVLVPLALSLMGAAAPPDETQRTTKAFAQAVVRSHGPHSGTLFALPSKYAYVIDDVMLQGTTSHFERNGKVEEIKHFGDHHGTFWDYDTRIPLAIVGAGRVKAGVSTDAPATQQDLAPTIAALIGAVPPEDAAGRVLTEALEAKRPAQPPAAFLMLVLDQGGRSLLAAHPGAAPFLESLKARGTWFEQARLTHIDPETIVGHIAIGTGAYPAKHGVSANKPWIAAAGVARMAVQGDRGPTPALIQSPSLADAWLRQTNGKAKIISQSLADRAAMGMAGHGALFAGNPKPLVQWYADAAGHWVTNDGAYRQGPGAAEAAIAPYWKGYAPDGTWRGHRIDDATNFRMSPAIVKYDGDAMAAAIDQEDIGADDVPDLVFWSIKACDYTSHRYGLESLETRDALQQADQQARRIVEKLEAKVGKTRFAMAFTADHGGGPLVELNGGQRVSEQAIVGMINAKFDKLDNRVGLAQSVTSTQIFLDAAEMRANGVKAEAVRDFVKTIAPNGRPFFAAVMTIEDARKTAAAK